MTENQAAEWLNGIFQFNEKDNFQFQEKNQILSHTALKQLWKNEFKDKLVLVIGFGSEEVAAASNATYISVEEYLDMYPELVPNSSLRGPKYKAIKQISKRLNIDEAALQNDYL